MKKKVSMTIEQKLLDEAEKLVDGMAIRNLSQSVEYLMSKSLGSEKTAVILCGGPEDVWKMGNDYRCTVSINSVTITEDIVKKLRTQGFTKIFIVARDKILTKIFKLLGNGGLFGVEINYVKETEGHGSADSLRLLKGKIKKNFLIIFGDIYFDINLNDLWQAHMRNVGGATILLTSVSMEKPSERGIVSLEGNRITDFIQKPKHAESYLVFEPLFVAGPEIFEYDGASLEKNVFPIMAKKNMLFGHITSGIIININNTNDLKKAKIAVQAQVTST